MSFDFFPNEQQGALLNAARHPSVAPGDPGPFTNFLPGAGAYAMRSLVEAGRAVDLAGSVFPIAADAVTGGTARQDQYFKEHDEIFNRARDYWTPDPGSVGLAGQVAGQLAGGVLQAAISPALLVGTAQLGTAEDLVRAGTDAGAANVVGDIAGLGAAVGLKAPIMGSTLVARVLSGAAGNVAQGVVTAAGSRAVLRAAGDQQEAQYDPWELRGRLVDALLGAAFGGMAHLDAAGQPVKRPNITPNDQAALLVANDARHLEQTTAPGRPASAEDVTTHVEAMKTALDQMARGEPVSVDHLTAGLGLVPDAAQVRDRLEVQSELARLAAEEVPPAEPVPTDAPAPSPVAEGDQADPALQDAALPADLTLARAHAALAANPDLIIPTGHVDALGQPLNQRAADVLAAADHQVNLATEHAPDLFRTAAACLLGVL